MIEQIIDFHKSLKKGQYVKIVTGRTDYDTKVDRTDVISQEVDTLVINRANGARVALNTNFVVMACIVERL